MKVKEIQPRLRFIEYHGGGSGLLKSELEQLIVDSIKSDQPNQKEIPMNTPDPLK